MTNESMTRVNTKIKRVFKATASVLLIASMVFTTVFSTGSSSFAAENTTGEVWAVTIGDEEILYVDSEESGNQVIEGLKNYYLSEGSNVIDVQFDPVIEIKKVTSVYGLEFEALSNNTTDVEDAVEQLSEGKVEYYVYKTEDFVALAGKRYHAKRNHVARFSKNYSSSMTRLTEADIPDIVEFERAWLKEHDFDGSAEESAARESEIVRGWIKAALAGDLVCDILRVDGKMAGIAIGEILPTGTAIEMYEKADTRYDGVYSYLAHEFAARNFTGCEYINRQEDMGLEGLRKSKLSYYPAFLLEKYVLKPAGSFSDCYADRMSKLFSKTMNRVGTPRVRFDVRVLSDADYDEVMSFLEGEREKLADKLFFLNYTPEELHGVLTHGTMLGAYSEGRLIATCAVDRDEEYGASLAEICGKAGSRFYEFSGIMTAADMRGRGVSSTLCRDVIAYAKRELSPCTLCAVVQYDNEPSLNNLKALGFAAVTTRPCGEYNFTYLTLNV